MCTVATGMTSPFPIPHLSLVVTHSLASQTLYQTASGEAVMSRRCLINQERLQSRNELTRETKRHESTHNISRVRQNERSTRMVITKARAMTFCLGGKLKLLFIRNALFSFYSFGNCTGLLPPPPSKNNNKQPV